MLIIFDKANPIYIPGVDSSLHTWIYPYIKMLQSLMTKVVSRNSICSLKLRSFEQNINLNKCINKSQCSKSALFLQFTNSISPLAPTIKYFKKKKKGILELIVSCQNHAVMQCVAKSVPESKTFPQNTPTLCCQITG